MKAVRNHYAYWAFIGHRLSGLALALFLPLHFLALGLALEGEASLDQMLKLSDMALFKFAEWGLVSLLALHLLFGARLLIMELLPWGSDVLNDRAGLVGWSVGLTLAAGLVFIVGVA